MKDNFLKKKFRNEYHKVIVNIHHTGSFMIAGLQVKLQKFGITHPQFTILRILQMHAPDALSMGKVKENMLDRNSDLTRLVDRLYAKGLVKREVDETNRRKINLSLSDKGTKLLDSIDAEFQEYDKLIADMDEKDVKIINNFLTEIRQRFIDSHEE